MTVMSEGLLLNSKYIKMGREEGGFQAFLTQPPLVIFLPCGLTVIHLRFCDRQYTILVKFSLSMITGITTAPSTKVVVPHTHVSKPFELAPTSLSLV